MKIHLNTGGLAATNAYLLVDEATNTAALIDAPKDTIAPLLALAQQAGYAVPLLLLTHGHWDHLSDHAVYTAAYPQGRILMHKLDEPKLQKPGSSLWPLPYTIPPRNADGYLEDGQKVQVGRLTLEVIFTPGHAPGHVCFYIAQENVLIAGDLLFAQSIGRTDLPDSDPAAMRRSLAHVLQLPDATAVLPGHGPDTTLGEERRVNPWLSEFRR